MVSSSAVFLKAELAVLNARPSFSAHPAPSQAQLAPPTMRNAPPRLAQCLAVRPPMGRWDISRVGRVSLRPAAPRRVVGTNNPRSTPDRGVSPFVISASNTPVPHVVAPPLEPLASARSSEPPPRRNGSSACLADPGPGPTDMRGVGGVEGGFPPFSFRVASSRNAVASGPSAGPFRGRTPPDPPQGTPLPPSPGHPGSLEDCPPK